MSISASGVRTWGGRRDGAGRPPRKDPISERPYSLSRAIAQAIKNDGFIDGYEGEISALLRQQNQLIPGYEAFPSGMGVSLSVPFSAFSFRQLDSVSGAGAIGQDLLEMSGIAQWAAVGRSGATFLPGLSANVSIHHTSGFGTVTWLPESGALVESTPEFAASGLKPYRAGSMTRLSRQLSVMTGAAADSIVAREIGRALGAAIDNACLYGSGNLQPRGVLSTPGTIDLELGAATIWPYLCEARRTVLEASVEEDVFGFISSPLVEQSFNSDPIAPNTGTLIAQAAADLGWGTEFSLQVTDHRIFTGLWSYLVVGVFGHGVDLVVDPYSLAHDGMIRVIGNSYIDVAIRFPGAFCWSEQNAVPRQPRRDANNGPAVKINSGPPKNQHPARPEPEPETPREPVPPPPPAPESAPGSTVRAFSAEPLAPKPAPPAVQAKGPPTNTAASLKPAPPNNHGKKKGPFR